MLAWPGFHKMPNPYTRALYAELIRFGVRVEDFSPTSLFRTRAHIWHLQAPDHLVNTKRAATALLRVLALFGLLLIARLRRIRILWTINNLESHERWHPLIERLLWRGFVLAVDGHISYSLAAQKAALARHPRLRPRPGWVVPHGHYRGLYDDRLSKEEARRILELSPTAPVVTFFGSIREYKNVPHLVRTFGRLRLSGAVLLVAGAPAGERCRRHVEEAARGVRSVRLHLGLVPDDRVQVYMKAADLVALPFRDILNSGSALLALSFSRPVLVPFLGAMGELRETVGDSWLFTYEGLLTPELLREAILWSLEAPRADQAPLEGLDWKAIARGTLMVYQTLAAPPAPVSLEPSRP